MCLDYDTYFRSFFQPQIPLTVINKSVGWCTTEMGTSEMLNVIRISSDCTEIVHHIQKNSYEPLLEIYHDFEISPALETLEQIREKIIRTGEFKQIIDNIDPRWI